jgi:hypothetical protein
LSRLCNSKIDSLAIPNTFPVSWDFGFRRSLNDEEVGEVCVTGVIRKSQIGCCYSGYEKLESGDIGVLFF